MDNVLNILLAGFGGQGVLFAGKVLAYACMIEEKEVSWLPSYGPEMRGGTANCSVCVSTQKIGSPLVTKPNIFIAMNGPSFDKFADDVKENGVIIADSSLIKLDYSKPYINLYSIAATELAQKNNIEGFSNMILLGKLIKEHNICSLSSLDKSIEECVSLSKINLISNNKRAIKIGYNFN